MNKSMPNQSITKTSCIVGVICMLFVFTGCDTKTNETAENKGVRNDETSELSDAQKDKLGITNKDFLSAASKLALKWPNIGNDWFVEFLTEELKVLCQQIIIAKINETPKLVGKKDMQKIIEAVKTYGKQ